MADYNAKLALAKKRSPAELQAQLVAAESAAASQAPWEVQPFTLFILPGDKNCNASLEALTRLPRTTRKECAVLDVENIPTSQRPKFLTAVPCLFIRLLPTGTVRWAFGTDATRSMGALSMLLTRANGRGGPRFQSAGFSSHNRYHTAGAVGSTMQVGSQDGSTTLRGDQFLDSLEGDDRGFAALLTASKAKAALIRKRAMAVPGRTAAQVEAAIASAWDADMERMERSSIVQNKSRVDALRNKST